jgi:2-amino-4-hydroxy-6-hydroxymethyldihydropteridine diphosphokinase
MEMLAARSGATLRKSRLWRTPAFPPGAGPAFVNAAAALDWEGGAPALLDLLHAIEAALGRRRTARWEARIMDLDLLAIGDTVLPDLAGFLRWARLQPETAASVTPDRLILPHPRMAERGFVLAPLADVAPDWRHPVFGRTVAEMLADLPPEALRDVAPLPRTP